jgi:hypothetical protein
MHLPAGVRSLGLLVAAVTAGVALWAAASPPATSTLAPGAVGRR